FLEVERGAGRLLTIAQGRVENANRGGTGHRRFSGSAQGFQSVSFSQQIKTALSDWPDRAVGQRSSGRRFRPIQRTPKAAGSSQQAAAQVGRRDGTGSTTSVR